MTPQPRSRVVVAIDGPAGSGKSSTARGVAREAGLRYLDTGALYRAMTWWMLEHGVDVEDAAAVAAACDEPRIDITTDPQQVVVSVDGVDVSAAIREPRVAQAVSAVSRVPRVREALVDRQRRLIGDGGIVVEGRDIGTVVAPEADLKVFLVASDEERARRRSADLGRGSSAADLEATRAAMARRDHLDSTRAASPLTKADDAIEVDTTSLSLGDVVAGIVARIEGAA